MADKHEWTLKDDLICCTEYLNFIFKREKNDSAAELLRHLEGLLPHISRGSLRMKIQNIKQVALDEGLEDQMDTTPLKNYSLQCREAFLLATDALDRERKAANGGGGAR